MAEYVRKAKILGNMANESQIIMQLDAIAHKVDLQTRLLNEARQRIKELEAENSKLNETIQERDSQLKVAKDLKEIPKKPAVSPKPFINSEEIAKIVSDNPTSTVLNAELKRKLDEYIQEIDRCIVHLSNLS